MVFYGIEYTNTAGEKEMWSGRTTLGQLELFRTVEGTKVALKRTETWQKNPIVVRVVVVLGDKT